MAYIISYDHAKKKNMNLLKDPEVDESIICHKKRETRKGDKKKKEDAFC